MEGAPVIEDIPAVREQLSDHWEKIALDLVKRGFAPAAVFETLTTVGLAGQVELQGKDATAQKLVAIAARLSEQVKQEMAALREASEATKN
jgi:hypothetical protein